MRAHLLLAPTLAATALVVGCEWTSSDGISWDESYNNVSFSGTYHLSDPIIYGNGSGKPSSSGTVKGQFTETFTKASGTVHNPPVLANSVGISVKTTGQTVSFSDDGSGTLKCTAAPSVSGTIAYASGYWQIDDAALKTKVGEFKSATVSYSMDTSSGGSETPSEPANTTAESNIYYMTVQQTGQHVSITFSNTGWTFSGKISGFSTDSDTIEHASSVIAKFSASGDHGTITGTLNSLASSRQIDGVWTYKGSAQDFVGSAVGPGRNISSNIEATTVE